MNRLHQFYSILFIYFYRISATCEKNWPTERHLYYNMAQLSVAYNFTWSRWNYAAGRRSIVMQMREYKPERAKQVSVDKFSMQ